jgi:hypothetical protein
MKTLRTHDFLCKQQLQGQQNQSANVKRQWKQYESEALAEVEETSGEQYQRSKIRRVKK